MTTPTIPFLTFRFSVQDLAILLLFLAIITIFLMARRINTRRRYENILGSTDYQTATVMNAAASEALAGSIITKLEDFDANKEYLDSADIKQLFKVGDKTLYRWRKKDILPYVTMGGILMYPKKDIMMMLQAKLDNKYDPINIKPHQKGE